MNRFIAKIHLWCAFGYLIIFFISYFFSTFAVFNLFPPLLYYVLLFIIILIQIFFTRHCFSNYKLVSSKRALLYLLWQCFLLVIFLQLLPLIKPNLSVLKENIAFLTLAYLHTIFGGIGYTFNFNINNTISIIIINLLALLIPILVPNFLCSVFPFFENKLNFITNTSILGFFMSTFCSYSIYKIKSKIQEEDLKDIAPNYAFITIFSFTYFILCIARIIKKSLNHDLEN